MTTLYTIGFTKKSLEEFVELLREHKITRLVDIRLRRESQLSGFAKEKDLKYITEKVLNIKYDIIPDFAPTEELLKQYQKDKDWDKYERDFLHLINKRDLKRFRETMLNEKEKICLLCSESEPDKCHRRLIAEFFTKLGSNVTIKHI